MDTQEIMSQLQTFIRVQFKIPEDDSDFNNDVHLFDYGYIDSFGAVNLINFAETTFAIKITESDLILYPLNTIREIATFVVKRKQGEV